MNPIEPRAAGDAAPVEPVAVGAIGDALPVNQEELAKELKKTKDFFKCGTCRGNPIKHKSHFSRSVHIKLEDSQEERDAWRQTRAREQIALVAGGPELRRLRVAEEVSRVHAAPAHVLAEAPVGPWTMNFGKYSKPPLGPATINHIMRVDPEYFAELMRQTPAGKQPLANRPELTAEMHKAGIWTQCLERSAKLREVKDRHFLEAESSGSAQSYHRVVRSLHDLNVKAAEANASEGYPSSIVEVEAVQDGSQQRLQRRRKRKGGEIATRALKYLKKCLLCGEHGCVTSTCEKRRDFHFLQEQEQRLLGQDVLSAVELKRKRLIACLKYTNIDQRSARYEGRKQASRTPVLRTFCHLDRATPFQMAQMHVQDKLLDSLAGAPCPNPRCLEVGDDNFSDLRILSAMRAASKHTYTTISARSVFYRCSRSYDGNT